MITGLRDGCCPDGLSVTPPSVTEFFKIVLSSADEENELCVTCLQSESDCGGLWGLWGLLGQSAH